MRFGKIQYLNLLPFDVFLKSYPAPLRFKLSAFANCSYPSRLNQSFFFRRIDAGFISSIAGYRAHLLKKTTKSGIIAKGAVWSVLIKPLDSLGTKDYQSDTSNILSEILGLKGSVLIGDRALLYHYKGGKHIDMGKVWFDKHRLPFVFGRLCFNRYKDFYQRISTCFNAKRVKIPHYMLTKYAIESNIPKAYILAYLTHIYYAIGSKEILGIMRFYRAARLQRQKLPSRIYKRAKHQIITRKCDV